MNKKIAKELVIKWAGIIAKGAGTGVMTHPTEKEREQILEAIRVMKNLKTPLNKDFTAHQETKIDKISKDYKGYSDSPKSAHNFYYECPDCGYVTEEEPTNDKDTTRHNCSSTS